MLRCFYNTNFRLGKSKIRLTRIPQYKYSGKKRYLPDEFVWNSKDKTRKMADILACLGKKTGKYAGFSPDLVVFHTVLRFPDIHPDSIYHPYVWCYFVRLIKSRVIPICGNVLVRAEVGVSGIVHLHIVSGCMVPASVHESVSYTGEHDNLAKLLVYLSKPLDARYDTKHPMRATSLKSLLLVRLRVRTTGTPLGTRLITTRTPTPTIRHNVPDRYRVGFGGRYWFLAQFVHLAVRLKAKHPN